MRYGATENQIEHQLQSRIAEGEVDCAIDLGARAVIKGGQAPLRHQMLEGPADMPGGDAAPRPVELHVAAIGFLDRRKGDRQIRLKAGRRGIGLG